MIGIEAAYNFGDNCFNTALIRCIKDTYHDTIEVAVKPHCADAFYNIPWIDKITHINNLNDGMSIFKKYDKSFQITQNVKFLEYKRKHPSHSLIDTPLWIAREIGLPDFDQKPIFIPTETEEKACEFLKDETMPIVAIESYYTSGQSWSNHDSIQYIIDHFSRTHKIIWLSNRNAPPVADNMLQYTRRELIASLQYCDIMVSVGSGFFCAMLGLVKQPKKVYCLWDDHFYKYENRLSELKWHPNITWIHNMQELRTILT